MIRRRYRWMLLAASAIVLPLLWASAAQAISLIKVREIYAGGNNDSYVELEAISSFVYAGDTLPGKSLILFDVEGQPTVRFTFNKPDQNGSYNTRFLVGDTGVESKFGVVPDIVDPAMKIDPAGGAACWNVGDTPVDCVAWGDFSGEAALRSFAGSGAGNPAFPSGIPAGKAIERTEKPNCPYWLEAEDDTDDSATDFSEVTPNPQGTQQSDGSEHLCESGMPDDTALVEKPALASNDKSPHFAYTATAATSFQCKLDEGRFSECPADGQDYSDLADGSHTFLVRALNENGPDGSPAIYNWTVDTQAPQATIVSRPAAQSFGRTAAFAFSSDEPGSTFRCSLDSAPAGPCRSEIVLQSLTSGSHTLNVAAVDAAGNVQSPAAAYTWTVETQSPVTTIDSSTASTTPPTVAFTYHSNRPDAVFECSMDGAQFSSCPAGGATYSQLGAGAHTFSVRAVDSDGDVEASPPSYSFTVGVLAPKPHGCKKGFRKKVVGGTARCVRVRHRKHHHR